MKSKTETGLLLLLIAVILSLISSVISYGIYSLDTSNSTASLVATLPSSLVGLVVLLLILIGAILMFLGRKEFGEKHQQYIRYALYTVVCLVIIAVVYSIIIAGLVFSYVSSGISTGMTSGDSSAIYDSLMSSGFLYSIFFISIIEVVVVGLVWIFGLYQLENPLGKKLLIAYYLVAIVVAIAGAWNAQTILSELFENAADAGGATQISQSLSNYMWVGLTGLITLIGTLVSSSLLIMALYLPYKRITSGELVPAIQEATISSNASHDRLCPNCQRQIPFDAEICPYCGKHFQMY